MKQQQPNNYLFLDNPQLTMTDIGLVTCLISRCRNFADIKLARIRSLREKRKLALQDFWPILWKIEFWSVSLFLAQDIIYYCIQRGRKRTRRTTGEVQKHLRSDWLSIATHYVLGQSGRKEKKKHSRLARTWFPALRAISTHICSALRLVHLIVYAHCDWPISSFGFHGTQLNMKLD